MNYEVSYFGVQYNNGRDITMVDYIMQSSTY